MKNILIIGSGGREHALVWKLKQSPKVEKIFIAPGNAGTAKIGENINIKVNNFPALIEFAKKEKIELTIVGPDDPLAQGIVDSFQNQGLRIWGPTKAAAQIETSKAFSKELMQKNRVPTADFETFHEYEKALEYIREKGAPIVIKASGLALGKGVTVCKTVKEAKEALKKTMADKIFGDAGSVVVIEKFLEGIEFSTHAFCDGKTFKFLPTSQDHKPIHDGDKGPNTGGMGTIAPLPWVSQELRNDVMQTIIEPVLEGLNKIGISYTGLLYPGLMAIPTDGYLYDRSSQDESARYKNKDIANKLTRYKNENVASRFISKEYRDVASPFMGNKYEEESVASRFIGNIKVIEINARFGDPETQSYMRLLKTDLFDIISASVDGTLVNQPIQWHKGYAACIVLASRGYPGSYQKGYEITGIAEAEKMENVVVFHAGTTIKNGKLVTNGGRVLGVTAVGDTLKGALDKAYKAVEVINFEGKQFRTDIGKKSLELRTIL